ncbi:MAG TPA: hypothetical protein VG269_13270 [Tepidisphaeraceae bacterium]|jgi:hypothetical protein|nr:hypothetical protein [Tepidisphaeraceae bacterium]
MTPLSLTDLSGNAFRILGLTAGASQSQIDAAARTMRIWEDPASIPESVNDANWIGPVPRTPRDIENAVARLADPLSRLEERFWWFCTTPPASDALPGRDPSSVPAFHDAALVHLYHGLLTNVPDEDFDAWKALVERCRKLAASDDYLQWLFEVESAGDFEKRASLEEIAEAQEQIPLRLSTAFAASVDDALAGGDFAAAARAVQLVRTDGPRGASSDPSEALIDRMEDELAGRCSKLVEKIDSAWSTRLVAQLRPACNHAIARFGTVIQPLIDQLVSTTQDVDRQNRARTHGVNLLIHTSEAYEAIENFLASERTLETALKLAANTPAEPMVVNLLEKVRKPVQRQKSGVPRGQRHQERPEFKVMPGGKIKGESWFSAIPFWWLCWLIPVLLGVGRLCCSFNHGSIAPSNSIPHFDSSHPPPFGHQD